MKSILILAGLMTWGTVAGAAGLARMDKAVAGVERVVFETPGTLHILPGDTERLVVEAEQHVLDKLAIVIDDRTLFLRAKDGGFRTDKGLTYTLTLRRLSELQHAGSGSSAVGAFHGELATELSGSGEIRLEAVQAPQLTMVLSGSGSMSASGQGDALIATLNGSGDIEAGHFKASHTTASIGGSGSIMLHAEKTLDASIDGSGQIQYSGNPTVSRAIGGAGSIDPTHQE